MRFKKFVEGKYHCDNSDVTKYLSKEDYGRKIRSYRKQRHLSQYELSRMLGTNESLLSAIENGKPQYQIPSTIVSGVNQAFKINIAPEDKIQKWDRKKEVLIPSEKEENLEQGSNTDYLFKKDSDSISIISELEKITVALENITKLIKS